MSKEKWNKYLENEWRTPVKLEGDSHWKVAVALCKADHQNIKNLRYTDTMCGVHFYMCPECGNEFMRW